MVSRLFIHSFKMKVPFSSNNVRLSLREWFVVVAIVLAVFCLGPLLWERTEKFEPGQDYRLPYELSNDYWLYNRYCRLACLEYDTLVIGDSVVWGHYVPNNNTLSHYLNKMTGSSQYANLGVDGIHPVALAGLLQYYGRDIKGKNVILHFNPLWLSSKKHDLQIEKEFRFDHPQLAPQFIPNIPCYKDSYSKRIGAVIEDCVPLLGWASHFRITYFGSMDLPCWTIEHPYSNPFKNVTLQIPVSDYYDVSEKSVDKQDLPWVELDTSLQWRFFRRAVRILQKRGNTIFVLVGPFNEHILKEKSAETYFKIKEEIEAWLKQNSVPYYMPEALPGDLYRDASHPLSEGYAILAKQLFENESFRASGLSQLK